MIIFFVIIASIVVGVIVANFAKLQGHVKGHTPEEGIERVSSAAQDASITSVVLQRLNKISSSSSSSFNRKQAAEEISSFLTDEISKKVSLASQQLEKTVNQVQKSNEIIKKKYDALNNEKKRTEAVIRSITEGLVVVNENGEVLLMNPAAEKLLGVKKEEKIGSSILKDLKNEQLITLATESQDKDGKEITSVKLSSGEESTKKILKTSSAVIENEYGKTVGMVSVLTDVTKQKELDRMRSDFVSRVSHELRTPIVTTQNSIALLLDGATGALNKDQEKFLVLAQRNLKRLGLLIDDLLDLSKMEASKMKIDRTLCSIKKLIDEVGETMTAWVKTKNIKVEKLIQEDIPEISIDSNRIIQVLNNIIGNAVKFTPANGIITVEAKLDETKKSIVVSITDTGIGIDKEDLSKVFDKFQQIGERVSTDMSGTGLGLTISREIIELHGGKMWAESSKNQGAKIIFTLPTRIGGKSKLQ